MRRCPKALLLFVLVGPLALFSAGCEPSSPDASTMAGDGEAAAIESPDGFTDHFRPRASLTLEETEEVINVTPIVSVARDGRFVIADPREIQVRTYDPEGHLITAFGREGSGPGELKAPMSAVALTGDTLVVGDFAGSRIHFFTSGGDSLLRSVEAPVFPLYGFRSMDDHRLLLFGRERRGAVPRLLHVFDLESETIERSFFELPVSKAVRPYAVSLGWVDVAMRGDTLAAVFSLTDTVYVFHPDGDSRADERIPLPFSAFSFEAPDRASLTDARARNEWMQKIHTIDRIEWLESGHFVIQFGRSEDAGRRHALLGLTRSGGRLFEIDDTPRLLTVHDDRFLFVHPQSLTENRWLIASLSDPDGS